MCVTVISGDDHMMPLIVIERSITVPLDDIGAIAKIKNIVDVPEKR